MTAEFALHPGQLGLADLRRVAAGSIERLAIDEEAWAAVDAARALIEQIVAEGRRVYGVNTGFGPLSSVAIPPSDIAEMQRRMIVSHCVGVGPALPDAVVRQVILLKLNTLLQGRSGVGRDLIRALNGLFNAGALPVIPSKGSVGASGDLDRSHTWRPRSSASAPCSSTGRSSQPPKHWNVPASVWSRLDPKKGWRWSMGHRFRSRWRSRVSSPSRTSSPRRCSLGR